MWITRRRQNVDRTGKYHGSDHEPDHGSDHRSWIGSPIMDWSILHKIRNFAWQAIMKSAWHNWAQAPLEAFSCPKTSRIGSRFEKKVLKKLINQMFCKMIESYQKKLINQLFCKMIESYQKKLRGTRDKLNFAKVTCRWSNMARIRSRSRVSNSARNFDLEMWST